MSLFLNRPDNGTVSWLKSASFLRLQAGKRASPEKKRRRPCHCLVPLVTEGQSKTKLKETEALTRVTRLPQTGSRTQVDLTACSPVDFSQALAQEPPLTADLRPGGKPIESCQLALQSWRLGDWPLAGCQLASESLTRERDLQSKQQVRLLEWGIPLGLTARC
jgi:hypothetical protein